MKKVLIVVLVALIVTTLAACSRDTTTYTLSNQKEVFRFQVVEERNGTGGKSYQILKDQETGALYVFYQEGFGRSAIGGLSPLIGVDGLPVFSKD